MRFFLVASLFASAAFAADANSVKAQIAAIQNYTLALNGDTLLYNGSTAGIAFALQVQQDAVTIYKQAKSAIAEANAAPTFSTSDSSSVYTATNNLGTAIKNALSSIGSKANTFADLKPLVLNSLYQLKISTDSFADALSSKSSSTDKTNISNLKSSLDSAFNSAITTYGGTAR